VAAQAFAPHLRGCGRSLGILVAGAAVGAAGGEFRAGQLLQRQGVEAALAVREPHGSAEKSLLEQSGVPLTGTESRLYTNPALPYDQSKRVARWVLQHASKSKIMGDDLSWSLRWHLDIFCVLSCQHV
uniref:Uncharacterized protein n=1 Tax=Canis lupus familiaris TaxID=9615 RepID=A0A8C0LWZ9_CANLF